MATASAAGHRPAARCSITRCKVMTVPSRSRPDCCINRRRHAPIKWWQATLRGHVGVPLRPPHDRGWRRSPPAHSTSVRRIRAPASEAETIRPGDGRVRVGGPWGPRGRPGRIAGQSHLEGLRESWDIRSRTELEPNGEDAKAPLILPDWRRIGSQRAFNCDCLGEDRISAVRTGKGRLPCRA